MIRLLSLLILLPMMTSAQKNDFPLQDGTIIRLASAERGKELLGTLDEFVQHLSPFDLQAKLNRSSPIRPQDYAQFAAEQALDWSEEEQSKMRNIVRESAAAIAAKGLRLRLPAVIELVKSTIAEEGNAAGYTRGEYIVLADKGMSTETFVHELFHVYSRYNPDKEAELYEIIGFQRCNEVAYPSALDSMRLTNPDAPFNHDYINIAHDGQTKEAMMVLFANKAYEGGSMFQYLQAKLMLIEGKKEQKQPVMVEGQAVLLGFDEVENLFEQIGRNTNYNIHPEEISAEHFRLLLLSEKNHSDQRLIDQMQAILSE
ncbi:MAG: hypothetical protein AAF206_07950 [Bacteroidota bacterium]